MKKSQRKQQAGATLLESLAFLGIAAIVVVGAISMFRAAQGSAQANDMVGQLNGIRSSVKTLYASQASYAINAATASASFPSLSAGKVSGPQGPLGPVLISAGAIPDTARISGGRIYNAFGGTIGVGGNNDSFWIVYTNVPQEVCLKVAPQIGGSWMGAQINSNPFVDTETQSFPVATADAQCTPGTSNTIAVQSR